MRISDWSSDVCSSDLLEEACRLGRQIDLAGAAAFDPRHLRQFGFDRLLRDSGIAAGGGDQVGGKTLFIVEQGLQNVVGGKALVSAALGELLCGLQESARPLRIFLDVHRRAPLRHWCPKTEEG